MKKIHSLLAFAILTSLILSSCSKDDDSSPTDDDQVVYNPPTAEQFKSLQDGAFSSLIQTAQFQAEDGLSFISARGVEVFIWQNCLTLNGNPVTGTVDFEFAELFERGDMLTTNKTTTGRKADNSMEQLISGGEFYIKAYQNGQELETICGLSINVPVDITGGADPEMTGFVGEIEEDGNLVWLEAFTKFWIGQNQASDNTTYNAFVEDFGWFNCDYFMQFPDPKTPIQISLPVGFDNSNSNIYVSVAGQPNSLAFLYGDFPIGIEVHVIFVSSEGDDFRYAAKTITIENNQQIIYSIEDTQVASKEEVVENINALP